MTASSTLVPSPPPLPFNAIVQRLNEPLPAASSREASITECKTFFVPIMWTNSYTPTYFAMLDAMNYWDHVNVNLEKPPLSLGR
jgi:hypothetical protein